MAYSRDSNEDLRWDSSTGQYVTNSVSNPVFYIYPYGVEFTATYSGTGTTFNQNNCTVETDGNDIKHYTYSITTTEPGTLSVTSYGNNYSLIVNSEAAHYDLTITATKPSKLYSWSRKFYAWTIESGSSVSPSEAITFYTKTPNPVFDPNNDIYPELFDADGNSYGTGRSALMSWILTKNGSSMSETYFQQVSSSSITLRAIGPA